MTKRKESCTICEYTPFNFAGWWTLMPLLCCGSTPAAKKARHKRVDKK